MNFRQWVSHIGITVGLVGAFAGVFSHGWFKYFVFVNVAFVLLHVRLLDIESKDAARKNRKG